MRKEFMLRFSLLAAVLFILAGTASADRKQNDMRCHAMTIKTEIVTVMGRPCIEEADSTEEQVQRTSPREELVFFYHTDHLGSTNLVTDRGRSICHAAEYLPYGEVFLEIKGSYDHLGTPFKFNGKEMDPETGMLYYGARYYMPKYCQWPTCDPMELKYPGVSSYAFCHGNPVNRFDIDGKDDIFDIFGNFIRDTGKGDAVLIQTYRGTKALSSFDYSYNNVGNVRMLKSVSSYYLSKSDVGSFSIETYSMSSHDPQGAVFANDGGTNRYYVVTRNGKISSMLDNKYNFESVTFHESLHRYDKTTLGGTIGETNAVLKQTTHPSWKHVSETYKESQAGYAVNSFNNACLGVSGYPLAEKYAKQLNEAFDGMFDFYSAGNKLGYIRNLPNVTICTTLEKVECFLP